MIFPLAKRVGIFFAPHVVLFHLLLIRHGLQRLNAYNLKDTRM